MATVEIRTTTGLGRCRAGLVLGPTWGVFEVTPEQLAELRADHALELRTPQAEVEAKAAQVDEASATVEQLRAAIERYEARIAELSDQVDEATRARIEAEQLAHEAMSDNEALAKELAALRSAAAPAAPPAPPAPQA